MLEQGKFAEAKRVGQECLALCREIGLQWAAMNGLLLLSGATRALGEYEEARQHLAEVLQMAVDCQFAPYILAALEETVRIMMDTGYGEQAPAILVFLQHYPVPPLLGKRRITRVIAELEHDRSPAVFSAIAAQRKTLELESVIETCVDFLSPPGEASHLLTERELEILGLLASGLTNRQIADELFFSLGTVKWYNHQLYGKLGVSSRTQAIARARELKLLS
jgi:ATP/maltotriose-dependent transcriptional regulator MalT